MNGWPRSLAAFCPIFREDNQHNACHGIETPVLKRVRRKCALCPPTLAVLSQRAQRSPTAKDRLLRSDRWAHSY